MDQREQQTLDDREAANKSAVFNRADGSTISTVDLGGSARQSQCLFDPW